jgi:mannose-binding lectin 1
LCCRYHKEHPEAARKDKGTEFEEWFESDSQRELRQIFSGQNQIFEGLRQLNSKLDEIFGRQERTLSLLSTIQAGGAQQISMLYHVNLL